MADEPSWVKEEGEIGGGSDLGEKLVPEGDTIGIDPTSPQPMPVTPRPVSSAQSAKDDDRGLSKTLCFFRFITILTILLALVVLGANGYIIYVDFDELGVRGVVIRSYNIFFCVFVVFSELEWRRFTKHFGFLENWMARGLAYVFVGLISWHPKESDAYGTFENIISFVMMGIGAIYFVLGLACMKTVKEAEFARMEDRSDRRLGSYE